MKNFILFVVILLLNSCASLQGERDKVSNSSLEKKFKPSEDIVFVIDVSSSMLAKDFVPNRLEAVKTILKKIISEKETHQQMSIVVFSGDAVIICPLTKDANLLLEKTKLIEAGKLEDGTALGKGIIYGLYHLSKSKSTKKELIVFTDGLNNEDEYPPILAAQIATKYNIPIHSFGVGCIGTALTPVSRRADGKYIFGETTVTIDEEALKSIGEQTQGNYSRVTCNADLEELQKMDFLELAPAESTTNLDSVSNQKIDSIWQVVSIQNEAVLVSLIKPTYSTFKDKRDGQTYKWVRLKDGKKWMAQNLNYKTADSWCYDNEADKCAIYGRLYRWEAAIEACPEGWRLPTDDEWWAMVSNYGKAYNSLRGQQINRGGNAGAIAYKILIQGGFSALLSGRYSSDGYFYHLGRNGSYWTSTDYNSYYAWGYLILGYDRRIYRDSGYKSAGRSCRCLQDE